MASRASSQVVRQTSNSLRSRSRLSTDILQVSSIKQILSQPTQRRYAQPASFFNMPANGAFKTPPVPPSKPTQPPTVEESHVLGEAEDVTVPFDTYLADIALSLKSDQATSVPELYSQYQEKGGRMCNYVVPYDERPPPERRADAIHEGTVGDGIVMVVHALFRSSGKLEKICACSGFIVDAQPVEKGKHVGEVVITCAHTLEEMNRNIRRLESDERRSSLSFVILSTGQAYRVQQILSSMPRSDTIALQLEPSDSNQARLRKLPLSPFPVQSGSTMLTHLFGAADPPKVVRSQSRLPSSVQEHSDVEKTEIPIRWLDGNAWRRWGAGNMLGYRSYTNIEVEAGIHSSLPHILTTILPTAGSSGGPLVDAETGAVVGMISGRRMDNRVEGERGWGASSESIFEMFSLPGFMPTNK